MCGREYRVTPNTMPDRESPFLEPARAGAGHCMPCRNTVNWAFKQHTPASLRQVMLQDRPGQGGR